MNTTSKLIIFALSYLLIIAWLPKCNDPKQPIKVDQKKLIKNIKELTKQSTIIDSTIYKRNKQLKADAVNLNKQLSVYKQKYLNAIKQAPDTCRTYIIEVDKECSKKDSINAKIIAGKDSTITDQHNQVFLWKTIAISKDTLIMAKSDSLVYMNKLVKRRYWKGFKHGLIVGGGAATIGVGAVLIR